MNVLIVDDEPLARERLIRLLSEIEGCRVLQPCASNGEEALTLIDSLKPEVVLLDIRMPGMDGLQVAARLCEREAPPAVVFCTGDDEFTVQAFKDSTLGHLLKPVQADALRDAGVDVAVLANNHCCDGGAAGVRTTVAELGRCGILHTGVFTDSLDRAANNPLWVERYGVRFALLNYTYGTNGIPVPAGVEVNLIDTARMAADLAAARRGAPDCVAVCIHWGNEYERRENAVQRHLAQFLRRHGADLVVGSHPHVVQPFDADSSHVVLYSLGNFVSNQRRRYCDGGLVAEIEAVRHPDGRMSYSLEAVPVWVAMPGYRVVPSEVGDTMALPEAYALFREDVAEVLGGAYK